jgi:Spy/CpxP family protein refolding chaperone
MEQALGLRGPQGRWWNDPDMIQKLQLTDDQRKAMDQILLDHREKLIDMRAAVEKSELGLEPMLSDDQPNESQILAQIDKIAQARAELEKANARFLLAIRSKLSPDQWKQLQAARAQRVRHRGMGPRGMQNQNPPQHISPDGGPQGAME